MAGRFLVLLLAPILGLTSVSVGCSRITEPSSLPRESSGATAGFLDETSLNAPSSKGRDHRHGRRHLIAEAKEALGAILTGEQVYYQRFGTYTDAADTSDLRVKLGVHLDEPSRRWTFAVSRAAVTGFVATARGRNGTEAEGLVVSLRYLRGHPVSWSVRRHRP